MLKWKGKKLCVCGRPVFAIKKRSKERKNCLWNFLPASLTLSSWWSHIPSCDSLALFLPRDIVASMPCAQYRCSRTTHQSIVCFVIFFSKHNLKNFASTTSNTTTRSLSSSSENNKVILIKEALKQWNIRLSEIWIVVLAVDILNFQRMRTVVSWKDAKSSTARNNSYRHSNAQSLPLLIANNSDSMIQ